MDVPLYPNPDSAAYWRSPAVRTVVSQMREAAGCKPLPSPYSAAWPLNPRITQLCQVGHHSPCWELAGTIPGHPAFQCRCLCHQVPRYPMTSDRPNPYCNDPACSWHTHAAKLGA